MCGGPGTRLDAPVEKPLFPVGGEPMVDRVVDALAESRIGTTHAVVSPHAPETREHVGGRGLPTIETPGDGYVDDLADALDRVGGDRPVLTVASDLPLLAGPIVDAVVAAHAEGDGSDGSLAVCVPTALKELLGVSVDESWRRDGRELSPTGLNVVGARPDAESATERVRVCYDARLAVNVNRLGDAEVAEALV